MLKLLRQTPLESNVPRNVTGAAEGSVNVATVWLPAGPTAAKVSTAPGEVTGCETATVTLSASSGSAGLVGEACAVREKVGWLVGLKANRVGTTVGACLDGGITRALRRGVLDG